MQRAHSVLSFVAVAVPTAVLVAGCPAKKTVERAEASAQDVPAARPPSVAASGSGSDPKGPMQEHFTRATALHLAIVSGVPEDIRAAANALAEHEPVPGVPKTWLPHVRQIQTSAKRAESDDSVLTAATAMGEIAAACGACHQAHGVTPPVEPAPVPPPPDRDSKGSGSEHMAAHQGAVDRLWRGLVAHDDAAWTQGARALAGQAVCPADITHESAVPESSRELSNTLHGLAKKALETDGLDARAGLYGDMLATCGACHTSGC